MGEASMKRTQSPQTIEEFTVTLPFGYAGVASVLSSGRLRVECALGRREAALQTTPAEFLAQMLLAEIVQEARQSQTKPR